MQVLLEDSLPLVSNTSTDMGGGDHDIPMRGSAIPRFAQGPVGAKVESIYRDRLQQFSGEGQWERVNLRS